MLLQNHTLPSRSRSFRDNGQNTRMLYLSCCLTDFLLSSIVLLWTLLMSISSLWFLLACVDCPVPYSYAMVNIEITKPSQRWPPGCVFVPTHRPTANVQLDVRGVQLDEHQRVSEKANVLAGWVRHQHRRSSDGCRISTGSFAQLC